MKLIERLKKAKKNKKGFTLVELIVVIVILGILAAILIPSFTGYIKKANNAQAGVEARTLYVAGKTISAEQSYDLDGTLTHDSKGTLDVVYHAELETLVDSIDKLATYTITIKNEKVSVTGTLDDGTPLTIGDEIS